MEPEYHPLHRFSLHSYNQEQESPLLSAEEVSTNISFINRDVDHLKELFRARCEKTHEAKTLQWSAFDSAQGPYASFVAELSPGERLLLLVSLLTQYAPEVFREMITGIQQGLTLSHPHVGGYIKHTSLQFVPSLQTVLFLYAGEDKALQQLCYREVVMEGTLLRKQIISLVPFDHTEPVISDKELIPDLAEEYVHFLLQGRQPRPDFGRDFPARLLRTDKSWEQLVLDDITKRNIELLIDWVEYGVAFSEDTKGYFSPGYPALFYGPPGTGKSLSAALIGKRCGLNVFRVDASRIVSKYIGETEKNLVHLFQRMKLENERQTKKPILFFDEADVLFSKRTEVKDAKDKWANMETSVLLPLIEEYGGLVIVATNLQYNLDPAMDRRFQLKVKFPTPVYRERVQMWKLGLPPQFSYPRANSPEVLGQYTLSQASIINVLKGGCLQAVKRGSSVVTGKDIGHYINLEFAKSGLTPSWENVVRHDEKAPSLEENTTSK